MHVLKFGGSSVATLEHIQAIAALIKRRYDEGQSMVIVVSAMGKTTNQLIDMAKQISQEPDGREMDLLMATGEQVTISLLSMALNALGCPAMALTGFQAGIKTDLVHTKARIEEIDPEKILACINEGKVAIVAGFQGITEDGDITTLGRGGSDTTAVSIAAVLNCSCEIYTDVDGVYTIDPRVYGAAKKLETIAYEEMLEMASRGAKVLETRAVEMASKYRVPVLVAFNTLDIEGTWIKESEETMEKRAVTGLSVDENVLMVTVNTIPYRTKHIARLFSALAKEHINIDMISQTAPHNSFVNISFTANQDDRQRVTAVLGALTDSFPSMEYGFDDKVVKLSVVGLGMVSQTGVAAKLFELFSETDVDFYQVTTSEISISYTIAAKDRDLMVSAIAQAFDL